MSTVIGGTVAESIEPTLGDKVNSDIGLSYRPASPCSLAGRYDNPICQSWLYLPSQDLWIWLLVGRWANKTWVDMNRFYIRILALPLCPTIALIQPSRESARLFLHSSELGPPHPQENVPIPSLVPGGGGGQTRLRERGWGVPIRTRGQTLWYSRYICPLGYNPWYKILSREAFWRKLPHSSKVFETIMQMRI